MDLITLYRDGMPRVGDDRDYGDGTSRARDDRGCVWAWFESPGHSHAHQLQTLCPH